MNNEENSKIVEVSNDVKWIKKTLDEWVNNQRNISQKIENLRDQDNVIYNKIIKLEDTINDVDQKLEKYIPKIKKNLKHTEISDLLVKILLYFLSPGLLLALAYIVLKLLFENGIINL